MKIITLTDKIPKEKINKVFALLEDETAPFDLVVKTPVRGERSIELKTDSGHAEYFRQRLKRLRDESVEI